MFPHKNPFSNNFRSSEESSQKQRQQHQPSNIPKKFYTTTSNYIENKKHEWSISGSRKGKASNPTNKQRLSDSQKSNRGILNRAFIEDNYHFNDERYTDLENYSLVNCPSSNGMSHNYDTLVQDNEVTPAGRYKTHYERHKYDFG